MQNQSSRPAGKLALCLLAFFLCALPAGAQSLAEVRKEARLVYHLWPPEENNPEREAQFKEHMALLEATVNALEDSGVRLKTRTAYGDLVKAWYRLQLAHKNIRLALSDQEICLLECEKAGSAPQPGAGSPEKKAAEETCTARCHEEHEKKSKAAWKEYNAAYSDLESRYLRLKLIEGTPPKPKTKKP